MSSSRSVGKGLCIKVAFINKNMYELAFKTKKKRDLSRKKENEKLHLQGKLPPTLALI